LIKQRLPQKGTLDKAQPRDFFQTPNYATELLIPFIPKSVKIIWECAAGEGKIANVLEKYNYNVLSSDIRDSIGVSKLNFLVDKCSLNCKSKEVAIITNPPYSLKRQFFNKCIELDAIFAILISGDYSLWTIDAVRKYHCIKIVPDHRINFISPTGLSEATGHSSYFHSYWLTRYFFDSKDRQTEIFVELTKEMRKNI
jgi:hypothetical protein